MTWTCCNDLAFRCITSTFFALSDSSELLVHASGWILGKKELPKDQNEAPCLRLYHVYYGDGRTEELDEWDVMELVGSDKFLAAT